MLVFFGVRLQLSANERPRAVSGVARGCRLMERGWPREARTSAVAQYAAGRILRALEGLFSSAGIMTWLRRSAYTVAKRTEHTVQCAPLTHAVACLCETAIYLKVCMDVCRSCSWRSFWSASAHSTTVGCRSRVSASIVLGSFIYRQFSQVFPPVYSMDVIISRPSSPGCDVVATGCSLWPRSAKLLVRVQVDYPAGTACFTAVF